MIGKVCGMTNDIQNVYSQDDFLNGTEPFEEVYRYKDDRFAHSRAIEKMSKIAKLSKIGNFKKLYGDYYKTQMQMGGYIDNVVDFDGMDVEYNSGDWTANDNGISRWTEKGEQIACVHPVLPTRRLINVDSDLEKIELSFKKGKGKRGWKKIIVDKKVIASANQIVSLSEYGIAVTSENAKYLVQYLHDIENLNYEEIPENNSVTRLGWIHGYGFSPYINDLVFDGDKSFKHVFDSVRQVGSFDKWLEVAKEVRKKNNFVRLVLSASFASVLVDPCDALPFFVHLWGGSENGKTVSIFLAASVWANPMKGKYPVTFNNTYVYQELMAGFTNSMPLVLNELQVEKSKDFDEMIYKLCEGVGRGRGAKQGGVREHQTWSNCILTTGEDPISKASSGGGAVNRVIQLDCQDEKLFDDPVGVIKLINSNYGHAGKKFVDRLMNEDYINEAKAIQTRYLKELSQGKSTEKQAISASLILTADKLTSDLFFEGEKALTVSDIEPFLISKSEMSPELRAYEWINAWVAQNESKFLTELDEKLPDIYGRFITLSDNVRCACILRPVFNKACEENGFNPVSFLNWLARNKKIELAKNGAKTRMQRLGKNGQGHCVILKIEQFDDEEVVQNDENLPF